MITKLRWLMPVLAGAALLAPSAAAARVSVPAAASAPALARPHPLRAAAGPVGRVWESWAYDAAQRDIVLFGGDGGGGAGSPGPTFGVTWTWRGGCWTRQHPAASPPPHDGAALAWDPATRQLLLFGGSKGPDNRPLFNDTWVWDGKSWTQLHPATSPSPRKQADMFYDAAMHEIVMFGGNAYPYTNQTWAWNGRNWIRLHPATSPSPRDTHSLVYFPATRTAIMYGGFNNTGRLSDTWAWNGRSWTQLHPATSPGVVSPVWQAAYDSASHQLLLYGGDLGIGGPFSHQTWTWNGTTWLRLHPAASPGPRGYGAMTYNRATGRAVLFGGSNGSTDPHSVWQWDGTNWHQRTCT
jgi:galactose oxidase-like protein